MLLAHYYYMSQLASGLKYNRNKIKSQAEEKNSEASLMNIDDGPTNGILSPGLSHKVLTKLQIKWGR